MYDFKGKLEVEVERAENLPNVNNTDDLSDPYVVVNIVNSEKKRLKIGKTSTIQDNLNPEWFDIFSGTIDGTVSEIEFVVYDKNFIKSEKIGNCFVSASIIQGSKEKVCKTLPLHNGKDTSCGTLNVTITFSGTAFKSNDTSQTSRRSITHFNSCVKRTSKDDEVDSTELLFAHGLLKIEIVKADNLPQGNLNAFRKSKNEKMMVVAALIDRYKKEHKVALTSGVEGCSAPEWNESFPINVCHEVISIEFTVCYEKDKKSIGAVQIPAKTLQKQKISCPFPIKEKGRAAGTLHIAVEYLEDIELDPEVPDCAFKMHKNNQVKLFQDAHCSRLPVPIFNSSGIERVPGNAWLEIYKALKNAEQLIVITGWSVTASITLIREPVANGQTLGELLKEKAEDGVSVRLLLWNEVLSNETIDLTKMNTKGTETQKYFKHSSVKVELDTRSKKIVHNSKASRKFVTICYSHHQKAIVVDSRHINKQEKQRQLVAFVGGLDLTSGRYDTPDHPLFTTLATQHKEDFSNNLLKTTGACGPRMPWHDIHCQIIGPAAMDVLQNFSNRWTIVNERDNVLQNIKNIDLENPVETEDNWNVQLFRSISNDSSTFIGFSLKNMVKRGGEQVEDGIHKAYLHQIQRAQKFIYVENQYFMGSSHLWQSCRDIEIRNLVPLEIATKITQKIRNGEEFVAYIVIPMFPEGSPESGWMQAMLHWQYHTIELMYHMIAKAIEEKQLETSPQDYLLFLCLGKREGHESTKDLSPPKNHAAKKAFDNRRLMIYVHSKMAIFDDDYIIVGSANINDRSLRGNRDTEIAIGAYQPNIANSSDREVSMFRKSLWTEHMGVDAPLDLNPGSIECARKMKFLAEESLERYCKTELPLPQRHMVLYPLSVDRDGKVDTWKDMKEFPDTDAPIQGNRGLLQCIIPDVTV